MSDTAIAWASRKSRRRECVWYAPYQLWHRLGSEMSVQDPGSRIQAKDKAGLSEPKTRANGTCPHLTGMCWATDEQCVAPYDATAEMLDVRLAMAAARLMKRL